MPRSAIACYRVVSLFGLSDTELNCLARSSTSAAACVMLSFLPSEMSAYLMRRLRDLRFGSSGRPGYEPGASDDSYSMSFQCAGKWSRKTFVYAAERRDVAFADLAPLIPSDFELMNAAFLVSLRSCLGLPYELDLDMLPGRRFS